MTLESRKNWEILDSGNGEKILETFLKQRGIEELEDMDKFLNPSLGDIPSFKELHDSERAAKQIVDAIKNGKKIYIHGDFDADGISATSILWKYLYKTVAQKLDRKVDVMPYIPSRVDEGYGLSQSSMDKMIEDGANLIITVDCGVRDRELIEKYIEEKGVEVIVTDHHQPPDSISKAKYPVVHQMFPGSEYPEMEICGSAVVFLLTQAISAQLGDSEIITKDSEGLDLVGLATVTDMMPLKGVNRVFVKYGLEQMKFGKRIGLKELFTISSVEIDKIDSYHLGFVIGPRINAAGRIGDAMQAVRLLVSEDEAKVKEISGQLHNLNSQRQEETFRMMDLAYEQLDLESNPMLLFVVGQEWHEGIIGLVAGKIFEKQGIPTVVVTETEGGEIKGSARSISDFNITKALEKHGEFLEKYGGHAQAAGFTVKEGQLQTLKEKLEKYASENITPDLLVKNLEIDYEIEIDGVSKDLIGKVDNLKPFGYGNSKPLFALTNLEIGEKFEMSNGKHLRLKVSKDGVTLSCVMFNCDEDVEKLSIGDHIDIAGYIDLNVWNGYESVQIQVKEWRFTQK